MMSAEWRCSICRFLGSARVLPHVTPRLRAAHIGAARDDCGGPRNAFTTRERIARLYHDGRAAREESHAGNCMGSEHGTGCQGKLYWDVLGCTGLWGVLPGCHRRARTRGTPAV